MRLTTKHSQSLARLRVTMKSQRTMTSAAQINSKKKCSVEGRRPLPLLHSCVMKRPLSWRVTRPRAAAAWGDEAPQNPSSDSHPHGRFPGVFSGHLYSSASSRSCQPCTQTGLCSGKSPGAARNYRTARKGAQGGHR